MLHEPDLSHHHNKGVVFRPCCAHDGVNNWRFNPVLAYPLTCNSGRSSQRIARVYKAVNARQREAPFTVAYLKCDKGQ